MWDSHFICNFMECNPAVSKYQLPHLFYCFSVHKSGRSPTARFIFSCFLPIFKQIVPLIHSQFFKSFSPVHLLQNLECFCCVLPEPAHELDAASYLELRHSARHTWHAFTKQCLPTDWAMWLYRQLPRWSTRLQGTIPWSRDAVSHPLHIQWHDSRNFLILHHKKLSAKIHFIYFSIKKMYCIFKTCCIICLIFSKCCLCRNFNFFCSNNTFFINHAQNSEYQSRHLKD